MSNTPMTREQEVHAFIVIEKGGPDGDKMRGLFASYNRPLVGKVARSYRDKGLTWEELLSAGNAGLLLAITKFDYRRGFKFSTCAEPWIKGEITAAFHAAKMQRTSDKRIRQTEFGVSLVDTVETDNGDVAEDQTQAPIEAVGAFPDLPQENAETIRHDEFFQPGLEHDEPTLEEAADLQEAVAQDADSKQEVPKDATGSEEDECGLGLSATQARSEGLGSSAGCAEWDNLRGEDVSSDPTPGAGGLAINFASDRKTGVMGVDTDLIPALEAAVARLEDPRHEQILVMYFGLCGEAEHTLDDIGATLGISGSRVHAIKQVAIERLREMEDPTLELLFDLMQ